MHANFCSWSHKHLGSRSNKTLCTLIHNLPQEVFMDFKLSSPKFQCNVHLKMIPFYDISLISDDIRYCFSMKSCPKRLMYSNNIFLFLTQPKLVTLFISHEGGALDWKLYPFTMVFGLLMIYGGYDWSPPITGIHSIVYSLWTEIWATLRWRVEFSYNVTEISLVGARSKELSDVIPGCKKMSSFRWVLFSKVFLTWIYLLLGVLFLSGNHNIALLLMGSFWYLCDSHLWGCPVNSVQICLQKNIHKRFSFK